MYRRLLLKTRLLDISQNILHGILEVTTKKPTEELEIAENSKKLLQMAGTFTNRGNHWKLPTKKARAL